MWMECHYDRFTIEASCSMFDLIEKRLMTQVNSIEISDGQYWILEGSIYLVNSEENFHKWIITSST